MRELLKLGPLNGDTSRWADMLQCFDRVHVVMLASNTEPRIKDDRIIYHELRGTLVNKLVLWSRLGALYFPLDPCYWLTDRIVRLLSHKTLREIQQIDFDEVLVSYNDFDESAQLLTIFYPAIRGRARITRSYKESRPGATYYERRAFELADRVVLNHALCRKFFERDYGLGIFKEKDVLYDLDEDFLPSWIINKFVPQSKLSEEDGRKHVVILAGRVFSDTSNKRSGARLCYLDMIKELLDVGLAVHLHTLWRIPDKQGIDRYEMLQAERPKDFFIEEPLNFAGGAYPLTKFSHGMITGSCTTI